MISLFGGSDFSIMESFNKQRSLVFLLFICFLLQESSGATCPSNAPDVFIRCPKQETVARLGSSVVLDCSTRLPIQLCAWISPQRKNVRPLEGDSSYALVKNSNKDCNIKIMKVSEEDNGNWVCTPFIEGGSQPDHVVGSVIVAMAKTPPQLSYYRQIKGQQPLHIENPTTLTVDTNKMLEVTCKVPSARPAAHIRWFLLNDDGEREAELTRYAEQRKPMPSDGPDQTLKDRQSILKKSFNHNQNGFKIQCWMDHQAAEAGRRATDATLEINFKPFFPDGDDDRVFGLNENKKGEGTVLVRAHPDPRPGTQIQLRVGENTIVQPGTSKEGYSLNYKNVPSPGGDTFEVTITAENIRREQEDTELVLHVENSQGSAKVKVAFSKGILPGGLSGGMVAGIVVAVIIILLVIIGVLIARRKNMCSSDPEDQEKEGSDTESSGEPKNKSISDRLNKFCSNLMKPKKGKEEDLEKGAKEETVLLDEKPLDKADPESVQKEGDEDSIKKDLPPPPPEENPPPYEEEKNVVYAELDLKEGGSPPRKSSEDTTEYAEIVGTVKPE